MLRRTPTGLFQPVRSLLRPLIRPMLRTPLQLGDQSIISRAIGILRSFSPNASSYPFSTLQGAYQDTGAITPAVAVNDPIGLQQDTVGTNNATQTTNINRPTVQQDGNGRYYASFNGTNSSLALSSVPFQMADDFAVVACVNPGVQAGNGAIFAITNATATPRIELYIANATGFAAFYLHDDATGTSAATGATDIRNSPCVVTLWKVGNAKYLRVNSVQVATDSTALGTATFTGAAWGCLPVVFADYFNGGNYEGDAIKGTLTLAQVVALEKAAAQRAGLVL